MGTYGTYTGVLRWYDKTNQAGHLMVLKDGELQTDITGDYWASGATGFDEGSGFWLDRQFSGGASISAGQPVGLLLALTYASDVSVPATGITRLFVGNAAGNKVKWDGNTLTIVGTVTATAGEIGGWTIGVTALYKDGSGASDSAGMSPADYPFYAGALYADRASATWRVTPEGKQYIQGTLYLSQAGGYSLIAGNNWSAEPLGDYSVVLGAQAGDGSDLDYALMIGYQAGADCTDTGAAHCIMIGDRAGRYASETANSVIIGTYAGTYSAGTYNTFLGPSSGQYCEGDFNIALGNKALYKNVGSNVIGIGSFAGVNSDLTGNTFGDVVLIGESAIATADHQFVVGDELGLKVNDVYFGEGVQSQNTETVTYHASDARVSDQAGWALKLAGGRGTGTGAGGAVTIQTAAAGSSGSTHNSLVDRLKVDSSGNTYIGDGGSTNYSKFDNTGHLTMTGTAKPWDDIRIEPVARTTGTNAPTFEKWYDDSAGSSRGVYLYSFDDAAAGSEKEVFFTMQMPHTWDGGDIYLHVHWVGAVADTTATPRWGLEYIWAEPGAAYGDSTIVYATGNHLSEANITAHKHYITAFAAISPGTGADGLSSVLIGRLFRHSSDAADTYNAAGAKVGLLYIDGHYQLARLGSTDEYTA